MVKPGPMNPPTVGVNDRGVAYTDLQSVVAGTSSSLDLFLRDANGNALWSTEHGAQEDRKLRQRTPAMDGYQSPQVLLNLTIQPMLVNFFDAVTGEPASVVWEANFSELTVQDYGGGLVRSDYTVTTAGDFQLQILFDGKVIAASPYRLRVRPGSVSIPDTTAFGSALQTCGAGTLCTFSVEVRDAWGNRRILKEDEGPSCHLQGLLANCVPVDSVKTSVGQEPSCLDPTTGIPGIQAHTASSCAKSFLGSFTALFVDPVSQHVLSIVYKEANGSWTHIKHSPFSVTIVGGVAVPDKCSSDGQTSVIYAGLPGTLTLTSRDAWGNARIQGGDHVSGWIQGPLTTRATALEGPVGEGFPVSVVDHLNGTYYVEFFLTVTGKYSFSLSINDYDVNQSPFDIFVQHGFEFNGFHRQVGLHVINSAKINEKTGALDLTAATNNSVGAVWYSIPQRVSGGFVVDFRFLLHSFSSICNAWNYGKNSNEYCTTSRGEGFSFAMVGGSDGMPAYGAGGPQLGYGGLRKSVAIEFDVNANPQLGDAGRNHISIHSRASEPNSAQHTYSIAQTPLLPILFDGNEHRVRIRYDHSLSTEYLKDPSFKVSQYGARFLSSTPRQNLGSITIWIDDFDRPVLVTALDLVSFLADPPQGTAWVGFTASTGTDFMIASIADWTLKVGACANDCNDNGFCLDGSCICDEGFRGKSCKEVNA
eukprot:455571-Hanusia_phi.AAC.3